MYSNRIVSPFPERQCCERSWLAAREMPCAEGAGGKMRLRSLNKRLGTDVTAHSPHARVHCIWVPNARPRDGDIQQSDVSSWGNVGGVPWSCGRSCPHGGWSGPSSLPLSNKCCRLGKGFGSCRNGTKRPYHIQIISATACIFSSGFLSFTVLAMSSCQAQRSSRATPVSLIWRKFTELGHAKRPPLFRWCMNDVASVVRVHANPATLAKLSLYLSTN